MLYGTLSKEQIQRLNEKLSKATGGLDILVDPFNPNTVIFFEKDGERHVLINNLSEIIANSDDMEDFYSKVAYKVGKELNKILKEYGMGSF